MYGLVNLLIGRVILGNDYKMVVYIYDSEIFDVREYNENLSWFVI